jgi:hypothetical protein
MLEPNPVQFGLRIHDLWTPTSDPVEFSDIAALIAELDLVITVDTAIAHLAGAMGLQTWLLVAAISDWRWLNIHATTPWYPTMRLFRQERLGQWQPVLQNVWEELSYWAKTLPRRPQAEGNIS